MHNHSVDMLVNSVEHKKAKCNLLDNTTLFFLCLFRDTLVYAQVNLQYFLKKKLGNVFFQEHRRYSLYLKNANSSSYFVISDGELCQFV